MKRLLLVSLVWSGVAVGAAEGPLSDLSKPATMAIQRNRAVRPGLAETYGKLPLSFEANEGQVDKRVKFISRGAGYTLFLTPDQAVLALSKHEQNAGTPSGLPGVSQTGSTLETVVRIKLVAGNANAQATGVQELAGKSNYFIGRDPKQWRTNISNYGKVQIHDVYPGIDLIYYGNQRQLEHDFIVEPNADPKTIALRIEGADKLSVDSHGDLVLESGNRRVLLSKPVIYQEVSTERREIEGSYVLRGRSEVGFRVTSYDRTRPLVIDPTLIYSSYLGGSNGDTGYGIAVDSAGSAYVTGSTNSTDFPTTPGAFQTSFTGYDVFVTKFNAEGTALVYSTYLGGNGGNSSALGIAVDSSGSAYITGQTGSPSFPTTTDSFETALGGKENAFVTKLDPTGSTLDYSTYLGGSNIDTGYGIAVDSAGSAYVTGITNSTNFPTTPGSFQTTFSGAVNSGFDGAFVTKLNPAGSALAYSTYLAGNAYNSWGLGIAVDLAGSAYVTGMTEAADFPTTAGAFQPICNTNETDPFVTKLDPSGATLVYSTCLGGTTDPYPGGVGRGIAVDSTGSAYVTGYESSSDFPTTPGAFQPALGGNSATNAFVAKLNATGAALIYATYLGGNKYDVANGIVVDSSGSAYIVGYTQSANFPTTSDAYQTNLTGSENAFETELSADGSTLEYSTYLGGSGTAGDGGNGIAIDSIGSVYVVGTTSSTNFPVTPGAFQTTSNEGMTCMTICVPNRHGCTIQTSCTRLPATFVTKFSPPLPIPTITWATPTAIPYGTALSSTQLNATASVPGTFAYVPGAGTILSGGNQTLSVLFTPTDTTDYAPARATVTLVVNPVAPTVSFTGAPASAPYQSTFSVTATTNASTAAVITASGPCSISGLAVTITGSIGTCVLTANWAADNNYLAASATQSTLIVAAASCTVTDNSDDPTDPGSLRSCINGAISGETISFSSTLSGQTITLNPANGPLTIYQTNLNIQGSSQVPLTISGGNATQVLSITSSSVNISWLTIANGNSGEGGGIFNEIASLTLSNCTLSGNTATSGGGIFNNGVLTVINSTFSGNSATGGNANGGGIFNAGVYVDSGEPGGTVTVINSTFSGNSASGDVGGGAIVSSGYDGAVTVISSTIAGNSATGITVGGGGGGISSGVEAAVINSIVAGNTESTPGEDCVGCGSQGSLISTPTNIVNPMLAPLGNYGGPTQTMLPLPGSPAICAGLAANLPPGVTTDERGYPNTNTTYVGYSSNNPCVDLGAVQTNYALSFTTEPPSTGTDSGTAMSPAPVVSVTESGSALTAGTASVSVADANSDLTTSPATASTSPINGQATLSSLIFTSVTSSDTLAASLVLNTSPAVSITAPSTSFSVGVGTPQVTTWPTATAITYGQTLASSTLTGGVASVPGSFVFTNPASVPSGGTAPQSVTFTPTNPTGYSTVTGTVNVTVNQATPTVALMGVPASAPYEGTFVVTATTNASTTAVITANGSCSITGTTVTITAPSGTCSLTANWAADSNYLPASATQSTTATQAMPVITWATPAAIPYGTALTGAQLDATATYNGTTVAGTFAYTPAKGTVLTAGTQTLSVTFTPNKTADFISASASVTLQVNQATPKITWAKPAAIPYGTALSSTQLNATASVPGTFAYSPAIGTTLTAGSQTLSVTFTPTDAGDYTAATDSVTITVDQATPTITWATPAAITYGTALSSTQLDATASVPGTFVYSPAAGAIEKGGSDKLSVTFTPTDEVDYTTATASVTLQVNTATPTITWATPAAITYGTALSGTQLDATATYNGTAVGGTFVYTPAKGAVLTAGTQTLSVTFTPTNTTNYAAPSSVSVTLQVNQATPKITWPKPAAITYGTALSSTQLDATASVPGTFAYSPAADNIPTAGTQNLSVTFTPTDNVDYTNATDSVTITVNQAASTTTITANTPDPSVTGQSVTVSFSVTGAYGTPTGTVTVTASSGPTCSGTLSGGAGSCALTFTATGSPKLTAVYSGDTNFKASTSAKVTQTVQP